VEAQCCAMAWKKLRRTATRTETCTPSQLPVHIWAASCAGIPARKPGIAHVTVRVLILWAACSMVQPFPISNAPRFRVSIALFSASRFATAAIINQGALGKLVSPSGLITKSYATLFRLRRFFKWPNLDRRLSLVHRISYVWHLTAQWNTGR